MEIFGLKDSYWTHAQGRGYPGARAGRPKFPNQPYPALAVVFLLAICGCTNTSLSAARQKLAARDYKGARQDLLKANENAASLSGAERREVLDDLCFADFKIGAPSFPLAEQYRACSAAAAAPGSPSSKLVREIEERAREAAAAQVASSIAAGDFLRADDAVIRYRAYPDADRQVIAQWSREIWAAINRRDAAMRKRHVRQLALTVRAISREHPRLSAMSEAAFRHWIVGQMTVDGLPLFSTMRVHRGALKLWIPDNAYHAATLNLDRLARVNNGLTAHCQCDGHTDVALQNSGLPAYLVRLDPETLGSEVLILPLQ